MVLIVQPFLLGLSLISSRRLLLAGMLIGFLDTRGLYPVVAATRREVTVLQL